MNFLYFQQLLSSPDTQTVASLITVLHSILFLAFILQLLIPQSCDSIFNVINQYITWFPLFVSHPQSLHLKTLLEVYYQSFFLYVPTIQFNSCIRSDVFQLTCFYFRRISILNTHSSFSWLMRILYTLFSSFFGFFFI